MQADTVASEPTHLVRLVGPLCLEDLVGFPSTEPARLRWSYEWKQSGQQALFEAREREPAERRPEERVGVVMPAVDLLGEYLPDQHEAIVYLPAVRSAAR